jgi:general stress protein 26
MIKDSNLDFIKRKIARLHSAVMYSRSQNLVKLPNDIVTYVSTDDEGHLWFLSHLPAPLLNECEQVFPVRLHFFRKGSDFFVEVSGKATIVSNISSSRHAEFFEDTNRKAVLIKMTMNNVEYTEVQGKNSKTKLELLAQKSYKWMVRNFTAHHPQDSTFNNSNQPY